MHYLHATPRSLIWPFCRLDGAHSAGGGLKMLLGGRTAGHWPLSGPQGAAATLSHRCKTADCKSAIRAQPAVCQSDTFSAASCSRAAVRVKAGTVTGQRKQFSSRFNSLLMTEQLPPSCSIRSCTSQFIKTLLHDCM